MLSLLLLYMFILVNRSLLKKTILISLTLSFQVKEPGNQLNKVSAFSPTENLRGIADFRTSSMP